MSEPSRRTRLPVAHALTHLRLRHGQRHQADGIDRHPGVRPKTIRSFWFGSDAEDHRSAGGYLDEIAARVHVRVRLSVSGAVGCAKKRLPRSLLQEHRDLRLAHAAGRHADHELEEFTFGGCDFDTIQRNVGRASTLRVQSG